MSLVLVWETPFAAWDPVTCRIKVHRTSVINAGNPAPAGEGFLVNDDSTWNCCVDPEEVDVEATYNIGYYDRHGGKHFDVCDADIERFVLTDCISMAEIKLKSPIGVPDSGRRIEVSDLFSGTGERFYHFCTNRQGIAKFPLVRGKRTHLRIQGQMTAFDFVVPNKPEVTLDDIRAAGSVVDADRRGWY